MIADRKATILAGLLYFLGIIAGALSVVPVIDTPDYLIQISANVSQVTSGASFQFLMTVAYLGMAITLYPVLKKHNESLALGYVGFRIVAVAFIVIGVILLLLLLTLSQEYVRAGAPVPSHFQIIGELLRTGRDLINRGHDPGFEHGRSAVLLFAVPNKTCAALVIGLGSCWNSSDDNSKLLIYVRHY